jgi:SAM-dependent methyltransferase
VQADFDQYENQYEQLVDHSIAFAGRKHEFYVRAKAECLIDLMHEHVGELSRQRVLDVGCGAGITHRYLDHLGELHGVDASRAMIERARQANPRVNYHVADATALPSGDDMFDSVFAIGLFHHIDPERRQACVQELRRVTRRGGLAVIFEHNPLHPLTRLAVHRCEFDDDAVLLGRREADRRMRGVGFAIIDTRYILLVPWVGAVARRLERALGSLPLGAQYYVAARA